MSASVSRPVPRGAGCGRGESEASVVCASNSSGCDGAAGTVDDDDIDAPRAS